MNSGFNTLSARVQATVARWNLSLRRFSVFRVLLDAVDGFNRDNMSLLAASLSYYGLLAFFPLLLMFIALASTFLTETNVIKTVLDFSQQALPGTEFELERVLRQVVDARGPATLIGVVALLWSASGVFDVIQTALDRAWRVPHSRAFWQQRLISLIVIVAMGALFVFSIVISAFTSDVVRAMFGRTRDSIEIAGDVLSLVFSVAAFAGLYKLFPHAKVTWRTVLPGALVAAILWEIAKGVYGLYLIHFARFNLVYGSVGAVIGLLFWGYISAMILLFGAEISAAVARESTMAQARNEV
ncbi:MAG TPA: YihY/virulence factor BrkB family protein [Anaerolineae bacterium]|nr:YihY/virulence factor BrkB family protein [Anaerolineae bacterium]